MAVVIYIAGAGRSGSTVLDTVLGNHHAVESVGELINAPKVWESMDEYCACGELAGKCDFWSEVRQEWMASIGMKNLAEWQNIQASYERLRRLPEVLVLLKRKGDLFRQYGEGVVALYQAISRVSGKEVIVDSSKNPLRAMALSQVPNIDLRIIHLVRDGRGVAWSLMKAYEKDVQAGIQRKMDPKPVWRTALFWNLSNRLAEKAAMQVGEERAIRLRYEDFVDDPAHALTRISNLADLDYTAVACELQQGGAMAVGHTIAGNRLRMHGAVRLQPDFSWKEHLSKADNQMFWLLAGRMAARYGYQR